MPGSSNFVGEFLILLGVFHSKLVIAILAFTGVAHGRGLHAAPVHPHDAQPRRARGRARATSASRDGLVLVPLVAVILAFALYPQLALHKGEPAITAVRARRRADRRLRAPAAGRRRRPGRHAVTHLASILAAGAPPKPAIDWAALSPLLALLGGVARRADGRPAARALRPRAGRAVPDASSPSARRSASAIWQWGDADDLFVARARRARCASTTLTLMILWIVASRGIATRAAVLARARAARGRARRVLRAAADLGRGHGRAGRARRTS